ncbi:MAG: NifU family protein [Saprospiraceae bacterium]|nr:NifU family protein [Saprospiraceae bacterium]
MSDNTQMPVMLYTEQTPNPESIKYVLNRLLYKGTAEFKDAEAAKEWSPLAALLFEFPYVKNVYISNNFVTITKEFNYGWEEILLPVKEAIKKAVQDGLMPVNEGFEASKATQSLGGVPIEGDNPEIATRIKELIDTYVKPAVEGDGGNIEFRSFNNGVVSVLMQGSCSGCPSSTVTLKAGIEGMLKRMVPEVTEVIAEMG